MNKLRNSLIAILIILLIVFNTVIFVCHIPQTPSFWAADVFAAIAMLAQLMIHLVAYDNSESLMSRVYGFPIAKVGYLYLIVQLIISLLFIVLSVLIPAMIVISVSVIILGAAAIGIIITDNTRDIIEAIDTHAEFQTEYMKGLQARTRSIALIAEDVTLKNKLKKFADEVYYSDSVSSPELGHVENDLWNTVASLEKAVKIKNTAEANALLSKAENLLVERNNLCALYKKRNFNQGSPSND